jgi:hypothetical protein
MKSGIFSLKENIHFIILLQRSLRTSDQEIEIPRSIPNSLSMEMQVVQFSEQDKICDGNNSSHPIFKIRE